MASFESVEVKDGVDQETVDAVREVGGAYKYGWETDIEMEYAPKGLNSDIVKLISCLLYTSPSPRDATLSRMPSSA